MTFEEWWDKEGDILLGGRDGGPDAADIWRGAYAAWKASDRNAREECAAICADNFAKYHDEAEDVYKMGMGDGYMWAEQEIRDTIKP